MAARTSPCKILLADVTDAAPLRHGASAKLPTMRTSQKLWLGSGIPTPSALLFGVTLDVRWRAFEAKVEAPRTVPSRGSR